MPNVTVTQHESVFDVFNTEFIEIDEAGNLTLLDEDGDILGIFASGTWTSVVKKKPDETV